QTPTRGYATRLSDMTDKELNTLLREVLREDRGTDCPSTDDLWDFVAKTLSEEETARVHAHIAACSRCARDVGRFYRGLKHLETRRDAIQQHIDSVIASAPPKRSRWLGWLKLFHAPSVRWGLAAATVVLIIALMWKLRSAPRSEMMVKKDSAPPKSAPQIVQDPDKVPDKDQLPPQKPQPPQPPPQQRPPQKKRRSGLLARDDMKPTKAEARFLAMAASLKMTMRSGGDAGGLLRAAQPHLTIVLSQTPELVAEVTDITGPFTFTVNELLKMDGGAPLLKEEPVITATTDTPSLTLTKKLERGKIYIWQVRAGEGEETKTSSAMFMVAEHSTADAAKKYMNTPLKLAEFYKQHGLYLDAQTTLEAWLAKRPADAKAQRLKRELERVLNPKVPSTPSP
ncbi:MAG: zf-HC2 domain-containing protein, partial [Abditibacteriales bacterium]|nr:zf-HC2 domain-containing protein [Abditibacteriales bacterium]MDW8366067.1 zf-HC2 domain-containing protein [Abditibacteriales bacterium]